MRDDPNIFNDAVKSATGEQNLRKCHTLRTGTERKETTTPRQEEPMDIALQGVRLLAFIVK